MKLHIIFNNYFFLNDLKFLLLKNLNFLLIKTKLNIIKLNLPYYYFYYLLNNKINLIFLNKFFFITCIKQIYYFYTFFYKFYFFRLKLKGLGYRIKKITKKIYRFFMAYNHFFYLYIPKNIYIWNKKRNLLVLSLDKIKLNNFFFQLIYLKKIDFYEKTKSFIIPNKILFIKK